MSATLRKVLVWAGLILFGIIAGRSMRDPAKPDPLVPQLRAERDSARLALIEAQALITDAAIKADSVQAFRIRQAARTTERKRQASQIGNDLSQIGSDTAALKARADTLWHLYATCSVEADSLNGAVDRMLGAYRECAQAADLLTTRLVKAEGMLNQAQARITQLSGRSRFRLGLTVGAVGGLDRAGPFYGPGAALGATLRVRLPLVGLPVGATVGGVGGLDLTGKPRVGVGAGLGISF